ncbi:hypothetical protein DFQ14_102319 [Halopolyspora algeriensis]|uniref:Uncharacterized protein n=1 Tax=Halopolyspora algeriensis TaxID=1500506 RepID=A0A368VXI5_9ACTN|nr:hypothetical protein DFQ14_102319 [Halopolyspora algeriensis]TQM55430.1 hypothetical protein FHU43_0193 [Halopolyspora algeriensis]
MHSGTPGVACRRQPGRPRHHRRGDHNARTPPACGTPGALENSSLNRTAGHPHDGGKPMGSRVLHELEKIGSSPPQPTDHHRIFPAQPRPGKPACVGERRWIRPCLRGGHRRHRRSDGRTVRWRTRGEWLLPGHSCRTPRKSAAKKSPTNHHHRWTRHEKRKPSAAPNIRGQFVGSCWLNHRTENNLSARAHVPAEHAEVSRGGACPNVTDVFAHRHGTMQAPPIRPLAAGRGRFR